MFRGVSSPIVKSVTAHVRADEVASSIVCPLANLNIVRLRKRRWIPLTPSKLFVEPQRTEQDPTEYKELKTLYMHYRTKLRSVT
jgi:Mitochondrial ribosome subunit S26